MNQGVIRGNSNCICCIIELVTRYSSPRKHPVHQTRIRDRGRVTESASVTLTPLVVMGFLQVYLFNLFPLGDRAVVILEPTV